MQLIRYCFRYREMLAAFIGRELRQRYVGSVLGRLWPFLHPLLILGVYYLIFVRILQTRLGNADWAKIINDSYGADTADTFHVVLLCSGLIPWLITAEFIGRCTNTIVENGSLVKKIAFPSELLPVYLIGSYFVNLLIMLGIFALLTFTLTPFVSPLLWLLPFVLFFHALFLVGLGYLLTTLNVFIRDTQQLVPLATSLWFFLTPIVYVKEMLPKEAESWVWIFKWNPMAYLTEVYRWVLIFPEKIRYTVGPDLAPRPVPVSEVLTSLGIFAALAVGVFVLGYNVFLANKHKFADEI